MESFKTVEEIFKLENLDANEIKVSGVPKRHIEAVIAMAKLFVVHDHINKDFKPDFSNYTQRKYNPIFEVGSSSGVGFAFSVYAYWRANSSVGSRLCSETSEKAKFIAEKYIDLYKEIMLYDRDVE